MIWTPVRCRSVKEVFSGYGVRVQNVPPRQTRTPLDYASNNEPGVRLLVKAGATATHSAVCCALNGSMDVGTLQSVLAANSGALLAADADAFVYMAAEYENWPALRVLEQAGARPSAFTIMDVFDTVVRSRDGAYDAARIVLHAATQAVCTPCYHQPMLSVR